MAEKTGEGQAATGVAAKAPSTPESSPIGRSDSALRTSETVKKRIPPAAPFGTVSCSLEQGDVTEPGRAKRARVAVDSLDVQYDDKVPQSSGEQGSISGLPELPRGLEAAHGGTGTGCATALCLPVEQMRKELLQAESAESDQMGDGLVTCNATNGRGNVDVIEEEARVVSKGAEEARLVSKSCADTLADPAQKETSNLVPPDLQCLKCSQPYDHTNKPMLLPCLHSLCVGCASSLACPICERHFPRVETVNEALVEGFTLAAFAQHGSASCGECGSEACGSDSAYCSDCCEFLCKLCRSHHLRALRTKQHATRSMHEIQRNVKNGKEDVKLNARQWCVQHPETERDLYCTDCALVVCVKCALLDHRSHEFRPLHESASNLTAQVLAGLKLRLDGKRQRLVEAEAALASQVCAYARAPADYEYRLTVDGTRWWKGTSNTWSSAAR